MPRRAWLYIWGIFLAAVILILAALPLLKGSQTDWLTVACLTGFATVAQLFKVEAPKKQAYFATPIFFFAGVILLEPGYFVLMVVASHLVEWVKERWINSARLKTWYGQPFNISMHIIAGLSAMWVYEVLVTLAVPYGAPAVTLATIVTVALYVMLIQGILGLVLVFAQDTTFRESGVLDRDNLLTEFTLASLGYVVSTHWGRDPWTILLALTPLILVYRALTLHRLKTEARTDPKTGLWNARHFAELFTRELERAERFNRPFAVLMADLDLLRNINNTYGHLAGDTVLAGIGRIIPQTLREQDIASRFGGEEFAILLPEATRVEAMAIAERLRAAIAAAAFEVSTSPMPIHATMSIGVACYPDDALTTDDLVHAADVAVYQAKIQGRNRVICHAEVPHSVRLEHEMPGRRLEASSQIVFTPRLLGWHTGGIAMAPSSGQNETDHVSTTQDKASESECHAPATPAVPPLVVKGPIAEASPAPPKAEQLASRWSNFPLHLLVGGVVVLGFVVTVVGTALSPWPLFTLVALLATLVVLAEIFQVNVYDDNSMSVGMAIFVATALICGIPGVAIVSAAGTIADHIRKRRPMNAVHKTLFNWANHVLACGIPVLAITMVGVPLRLEELPILLPLVIIASAGYYLVETWLISFAIALSQGSRPSVVWRGHFQWLAQHYLVLGVMGLFLAIAYTTLGILGMLVFAFPVWMLRYAQRQYVERTQASVQELKRVNHELALANREVMGANEAIRDLNGHLQHLNSELFLTLGKILDARDPYVGSHAGQVADYATAIAHDLGLSPERVEQVRQAGFLHDIGKIGISEAILHKPSKLTPEEYEEIKRHAEIGGDLLASIQALSHLAPFVRHHHERWDGLGYPDRLIGDRIPLEARILNVCDSVEAMASDRPYKQAMELTAIIQELRRCSGSQFDPDVVETFIQIIEREGEQVVVNSALELEQRQGVETAARMPRIARATPDAGVSVAA